MTRRTLFLCDFCNQPIDENSDEPVHSIIVDDGDKRDLCDICYRSSLVLAESRRVRTRRTRKAAKPRRKPVAASRQAEATQPLTAVPDGPLTESADPMNPADWMEPVKEMFKHKREVQQ